MSSFDQKAKTWDDNPVVMERSAAIAFHILKYLPAGENRTGLEVGAGTGQLSILLKDHFREITLLDSSAGMVGVMREKTRALGLAHLRPVLLDLEKEDLQDEFDLVFNQMVLHHVKDTDRMLRKFHTLLKPDGMLAIADLYTEDGTFHADDSAIHRGFDPADLAEAAKSAGFREASFRCCYVIRKKDPNQEEILFPVFLLTARR